jgi:hypothetical protein
MYDLPLYVISRGAYPLVGSRSEPKASYWLLKLLKLFYASVRSFAVVYALSLLSNVVARLVCVAAVNFALNSSLEPVLQGTSDYIIRIFRQPVTDPFAGWPLDWPALFPLRRKRERTSPESFPRAHKRKRI